MTKYSDDDLFNLVFKTSEIFYEKIYKDNWLKKVFAVIDQKVITSQQTDFMVQSLGGPKRYGGRMPNDAHPHIFINEEMWVLREKYLVEAFEEIKLDKDLCEIWLKIDRAFKRAIVKNDVSECKKRFATDEIIFYLN